MKLQSLIVFSFSLLLCIALSAQPSLAKGTSTGYEISSEVEASSGGASIAVQTTAVYVSQAYGLELAAGSTSATLAAGSTFYSPHTVTNVGNGSDTIHFSLSGTTSDFSSTLVKDDNSDSIHSNSETTPVPTDILLAEDASYYLFVALTSPLSGDAGLVGQTLFSAEGSVDDGGAYVGSNGVTYGGPELVDSLVKLTISTPHDIKPPSISDVLIKGKKRFPNDIISPSFEAEATILDDITDNMDRIQLRVIDNNSSQAVIDVTNTVGSPEPEGCYYNKTTGKFKYVDSSDLLPGSYAFMLEAWDKSANSSSESITPLFVKEPDKTEMIGPGLNYPNPFAPLKGEVTYLAILLLQTRLLLFIYLICAAHLFGKELIPREAKAERPVIMKFPLMAGQILAEFWGMVYTYTRLPIRIRSLEREN
ncbi:MAG: hypothetical protein ABIH22_02965 [Candidatus Margulisiibacteriota bacterium]